MQRIRRIGAILTPCVTSAFLAAPLLAAPPVTISPGSATGELIAESCPTFSWAPGEGEGGFELVVYGLTTEGELGHDPAIALRLPAGARAWTPAAGECLAGGSFYAWLVRSLGPQGGGEWSEPAVFEVALPSRAEVAEALATLRRYVGARGEPGEHPGVEEEPTKELARVRELAAALDPPSEPPVEERPSVAAEASPSPVELDEEVTGPVVPRSDSSGSVAIHAVEPSTSGASYGVLGQSDSIEGTGVFGWTSATSGTTYGIYGKAASPFGWAGYFVGSVNVTGTLWKGAGSFRIDHPLDPANRTLSHSFVESPDMMNVYNGNVVLDGKGAAWVELPDYFEALNRDFRYQLTALRQPAPNLHLAEPIIDNRFRIAGGEPGMEVSWLVTGIRQDAYAREHPIVVEEDKGEHRGLYLHPEVHGQPAELAIHRRMGAPEPPQTGRAASLPERIEGASQGDGEEAGAGAGETDPSDRRRDDKAAAEDDV